MRITKSRLREIIAEELREGSYGDTAYDRDNGGENEQTPEDLLKLHHGKKGAWHVKELGTGRQWDFANYDIKIEGETISGKDAWARALSKWYFGNTNGDSSRSMEFIEHEDEDLPPTAQ